MDTQRPTTASHGWLALACAALLLAACAAVASAQTGTSSVRGTATDAQGNAVAGASVTLTNTETNAARTQVTTDTGTYAFDLIPPGTYRLAVESQGFKKAVVNDVRALIAQPTETNVQLEVGAVGDVVTVTAGSEGAVINKQDATLGNNFVSHQITQLPLEGRNVASLLTLQPGVTRDGSVTGARSDQANVTLDGVDINEQQSNQIGSVSSSDATTLSPSTNTVLRLNAEAIDEFRVVTANPNAQFGRSSGAQVALVTKGGSNDLHGAAFWFHRPTVLTANDFFNNRAGRYTAADPQVSDLHIAHVGDQKVPRPALIRNTFGGALGGPMIKDRAFFFYSYEGRTDRSQQTVLQRVPLPSMGRGELRFVNNGGGVTTVTAADLATIFPGLGGTNPAALAALAAAAAKYPANDFGNTGDSFLDASGRLVRLNTAGYRFNAYLPSNFNSHAGRWDMNLTSKQQLFARVNVNHDKIAGTPAFPDTPRPDIWSHPWGVAAGDTWTLSNRFVNNFRYGLTREAFTQLGDAAKNEIYFRFVFFPVNDSRALKRVTPVHNFTDDFSWLAGSHTMQFGGNFRIIRNRRTSFASAFDTAYSNPSGYTSGSLLSTPIRNFFSDTNLRPPTSQNAVIQNASSALLGRLTSWSARLTYDKAGNLLPPGSPTEREFATEEYETYGQDIWKIGQNLTLTYGLRYSLSRPIYETHGYETKPNIPLSEYFRRRLAAAEQGQNYTETLTMDLSGPANGKSSMYPWDKNNFQPRLGVAWSPNFKSGFLHGLFGDGARSVIRGGFAMTNDFLGQQLATRFDQLNSLGFVSSLNSPFSFCNTTTHPCPLFSAFNQSVRAFPLVAPNVNSTSTFPRSRPADMALVIETSLDEEIKSPTNYMWNLTFERELPKGLVVQASYIGRLGRNLLVSRDVMMPNDLRDPKSGMDWYTAAGQLEDLRRAGTPINQVQAIPYFENFFGSVPGFAAALLGSSRVGLVTNATQTVYADAFLFNANDWTTTQSDIDFAALDAGLKNFFYQPQYGALSSFSTVGNSEYHGATLSVRERLGNSLTMDFNYTFSKSMDDASGLQTSGSYGGAFIINPIRQHDSWAVSDFDVKHIINFNSVWQLPMGRNRWLSFGGNRWADAALGNWQLSTIFRWNSGYPISAPYDAFTWATNWNVQSFGTRTRPIEACPTRGATQPPKLFGCNPDQAYQSFRNAKPGETGDRNVFRLPGYVTLDVGLAKTFGMPWSENHKLQLRFEAFNVTNTQRMGAVLGTRDGYGLVDIPSSTPAPTNFSNFTSIQGDRRVMQFGFRYSF
ncbi:MAG: carboxypeptidase-like regulatory domain-containing protein [Acidobacteria bacterium]|nr:carboxypeptidase-like regulatory domain-containing protein [Acidobacteriota bacterium]